MPSEGAGIALGLGLVGKLRMPIEIENPINIKIKLLMKFKNLIFKMKIDIIKFKSKLIFLLLS